MPHDKSKFEMGKKFWQRVLWLNWLFNPRERLSQRVIQAGFWASTLRILNRLFSLVRMVLLARLLVPKDFGLFGIALLALSILETFSETGFNAAIIQKKGDVRPYLDTAWTVQVIRGLFLATILLILAPFMASFFREPGASKLIRALSVVVVLRGFVNTGVLFFRKELEYHKNFIYQFSGTIVELGVAIPSAFIFRNVWALILSLITGQLVRMVVSYFVHPYRPKLRLEIKKAGELYTFGRWIYLSNILIWIGAHGGDFLVGRILGAAALGLYQMAYRISQLPVTEFTYVFEDFAFPTYAKLQENKVNFKEAYLRFAGVTTFLSFPVAIGTMILAPDFAQVFLGDKWLNIIRPLMVLSFAGFLKSIASTASPAFKGEGTPKYEFEMQLVRATTLMAFVYLFSVLWGISGAAFAVLCSAFVMMLIWYIRLWRRSEYSLMNMLETFGVPFLGTLLSAGTLFLSRQLIEPTLHSNIIGQIGAFIIVVVTGTIVYVVSVTLIAKYVLPGSPLRRAVTLIFRKIGA